MRRLLAAGMVWVILGCLAPAAQAKMNKRDRVRLGVALIVVGVGAYAYAPNTVDQDKVTEYENLADWAESIGLPWTARGYREEADDERDKASQMRLAGSLMVLGGLVALGSAAADRPASALAPPERGGILRFNAARGRIEYAYRTRF